MDILRPDGTVLQTISLGKPVPAATTNLITASLNVQPIAFGVGYSVRVRAVAAGPSVSEWTNSLNKFDRAPGPPSNAVVK
jgi:cellulase/cellobiase CelA1